MKNQASPMSDTQAGSIFLWIFIMIGLFGALSFAMSQGFRSGSSVLTKEKASLSATEIVEFLNKVKSSFDQMTISNGCTPNMISFATTVYKTGNGVPIDPAPASPKSMCTLYHSAGGALRPYDASAWTEPTYTAGAAQWQKGHFGARYIDATLGTSENDLAYYATGINQNVCIAVLNLISGTDFTSVPIDTVASSGVNSWTQGAAGSLNALAMPTSARVFAFKQTALENHCVIGIILKAY